MFNQSRVIASILFKAYRQGMYLRFPSITSMISSSVASHLIKISALLILYSFKMAFIVSSLTLSVSTILEIVTPPLSFLLKSIQGGTLFNLIPNPSNQCSIIFLCCIGLVASSTIMIRLHVLATAMTCLPLPLPSLAPSIIPGKSSSCILAPLYLNTPGIQVRVVNSYAAIFEKVPQIRNDQPVSLVSRVDLPTEGKPIIPTRASPDLETSNPYPPTPPFLPPAGSISSRFSLASLAFSKPKWQEVALFF